MKSLLQEQLGREDGSSPASGCDTAFGCPRDFYRNRYVYTAISSRAGGLAVGVNLNPNRRCNFDCVYCEVNRRVASGGESRLDVPEMAEELEQTLSLILSGEIRCRPCYQRAPAELLELRHVAFSGDGEPTLCLEFAEAMEAAIHLRACGRFGYFKMVLVTNASGLDRPPVVKALRLFTRGDEVWAKLEAGSQEYMDQVNHPDCPLEVILRNILHLAQKRPVIIQSLFPSVRGEGPSAQEVERFVQRLRELKEGGAQIPLVQIYSATQPEAHPECGHLPLRTLSGIARQVHEETGLRTEVF